MDNLRIAFWKASKGKRHSEQVLAYQENLETNLLVLREQLLSGEISVGNYHSFKIYDPKERLICASIFSEQVLHHSLMNICHDFFEKKQLYTSCASRKGKGTSFALEYAQKYTKKFDYFLKLDVRKYFDSIIHQVLKNQLQSMFKEKALLHIFDLIIDSYQKDLGRGLPIGNLSSQYFANHYLSGLDHFIKENLRCKAYIRYMDDMLLFAQDKESLKDYEKEVSTYVTKHLLCSLKPAILHKTRLGVPFLGYLVLPSHLRLLQQSKKRFFKKYKAIEKDFEKGNISERKYQSRLLSLFAFVKKAKTKKLRLKLLKPKNTPYF